MAHNIFTMPFAEVYPLYVNKVVRKGRTEAELREVITWLTGYDDAQIDEVIAAETDFTDFFEQALLNPNSSLITGSVCGVKVQEVQDPVMKQIRMLDKIVDELAQGKLMSKILRTSAL